MNKFKEKLKALDKKHKYMMMSGIFLVIVMIAFKEERVYVGAELLSGLFGKTILDL